MRPRVLARVLATGLAALAATGFAPAAPGAATSPAAAPPWAGAASTAVGAGLREFRIALYRRSVRPGRVRFAIRNLGMDTHDFVVRRRGVTYGYLPEVRAGRTASLSVRLKRRGTYTVVCTLADHEQRGMVAKLRVLRKKRR